MTIAEQAQEYAVGQFKSEYCSYKCSVCSRKKWKLYPFCRVCSIKLQKINLMRHLVEIIIKSLGEAVRKHEAEMFGAAVNSNRAAVDHHRDPQYWTTETLMAYWRHYETCRDYLVQYFRGHGITHKSVEDQD